MYVRGALILRKFRVWVNRSFWKRKLCATRGVEKKRQRTRKKKDIKYLESKERGKGNSDENKEYIY